MEPEADPSANELDLDPSNIAFSDTTVTPSEQTLLYSENENSEKTVAEEEKKQEPTPVNEEPTPTITEDYEAPQIEPAIIAPDENTGNEEEGNSAKPKFDPSTCSTESRVQEERIWARRHKINLIRNVEMGAKKTDMHDLIDANLGLANAQIERSDKKIIQLCEDGDVDISNYVIGAQKRFSQRRTHIVNELEKIQIMLEEEEALFKDEYEKILSRWPEIQQRKGPHSLQKLLDEQKSAVEERLQLKQRVILRIQQTLKQVDEHYSKALKKHGQDMVELTATQREAFRNLLSGYLSEMQTVQDAFYEDLNGVRDDCNVEFERLRQTKLQGEIDVMSKREELKEEFEVELEALRWNESERFNELKRKLENDVHTIEQQLMLMKAGFQMNAEKLEYNFQVLKRRDEENSLARSKQKRKITKLQDSLTKLRERFRRQEQKHE